MIAFTPKKKKKEKRIRKVVALVVPKYYKILLWTMFMFLFTYRDKVR